MSFADVLQFEPLRTGYGPKYGYDLLSYQGWVVNHPPIGVRDATIPAASPPNVLEAQDSQLASLYLYNDTQAASGAWRLLSFYLACYNLPNPGNVGVASENCTFSITSKYAEGGVTNFQTRNYLYNKASATKPVMQKFNGPNIDANSVYFALVGAPAGTPITGDTNFFVDNLVIEEKC